MIITVVPKEERKANIFTKALESIKQGWKKFVNTKPIKAINSRIGKSYKYIVDAVFFSSAYVVSASLLTGLAVPLTAAALYTGVKTLEYYNKYKGRTTKRYVLGDSIKHLLYSSAISFLIYGLFNPPVFFVTLVFIGIYGYVALEKKLSSELGR